MSTSYSLEGYNQLKQEYLSKLARCEMCARNVPHKVYTRHSSESGMLGVCPVCSYHLEKTKTAHRKAQEEREKAASGEEGAEGREEEKSH